MGTTIKEYFTFTPVLLHIDGEEVSFVNEKVAKKFLKLYCEASKETPQSAIEDLDVYWSAEEAMASFFEEDEWEEDSDGDPKWWTDLANAWRKDAETEKIRVTDE